MRKLAFLLAALMLVSPAARGAEKKWSFQDWLKAMESKIRRSEEKRKNQIVATAAVRGAKESKDSNKLYWKGQKAAQSISEKELDDFKFALEAARAGEREKAGKSLEEFAQKYPESPMRPDAEKTLALMKEEAGGSSASSEPPAQP